MGRIDVPQKLNTTFGVYFTLQQLFLISGRCHCLIAARCPFTMFGFCLFQQIRIVDQAYRCQGKNFCRVKHGFFTEVTFALRNDLPTVSGRTDDP